LSSNHKRGCGKILIFWKNRIFQARHWKGERRYQRRGAGDFALILDLGRYEKKGFFPHLPL